MIGPAQDRRANRVAARDLEGIPVLGPCRCGRPHLSNLRFVECAFPGAVPTTLTTGEIFVLTRCGDSPRFSMFRSVDHATRLFDKLNSWGCGAGCQGHHDIAVIVR